MTTLTTNDCNPSLPGPPFSLGWAAGFMDGEGCIHVAKQRFLQSTRKTGFRLRISIEQNDREVLQHFLSGVGVPGNIYQKKRQPYHTRQCWTLVYDGQHALAVVRALLSSLVRKHREALVAIQFCEEGETGRRFGPKGCPPALMAVRERLYALLRSLK